MRFLLSHKKCRFSVWDFCDRNLSCFMECLRETSFHCLLMIKPTIAVYLIHSLLNICIIPTSVTT